MKRLLFALALTIGSLPACTPLDEAARGRLIEYAHAIFDIPINDSLRIAEVKPDPKTCYAEITLTDSASDEPLRRILFVSPDHRFFEKTYALRRRRGGGAAGTRRFECDADEVLAGAPAGDELEIEASISLLGPVDPSIGPFRFALSIVPGANRATGIALSAGSSSAGPADSQPTVRTSVGDLCLSRRHLREKHSGRHAELRHRSGPDERTSQLRRHFQGRR